MIFIRFMKLFLIFFFLISFFCQTAYSDIIKRIELGNVSLPIPSTLIGGGQTLFGVRADFQFGPLFLKTLFSQRRGERKFVDVTGGASKQYFSLRAYDYAKNHFFLDTA